MIATMYFLACDQEKPLGDTPEDSGADTVADTAGDTSETAADTADSEGETAETGDTDDSGPLMRDERSADVVYTGAAFAASVGDFDGNGESELSLQYGVSTFEDGTALALYSDPGRGSENKRILWSTDNPFMGADGTAALPLPTGGATLIVTNGWDPAVHRFDDPLLIDSLASPVATLSGDVFGEGRQPQSASDLNDDGASDLLFGAEEDSTWMWVIDGAGFVGERTFEEASIAKLEMTWGGVLEEVGDVDGDGVTDLAVGLSTTDKRAAAAFVFAGPVAGTLSESDAVRIEGHAAGGAWFGLQVAGGDADDDGYQDLFATNPGYPDGDIDHAPGAVFVFYGPITRDLDAMDDRDALLSPSAWAFLGGNLAVTDLTGDGAADVAAGTSGNGQPGTKGVAVWPGPLSGTLDSDDSVVLIEPSYSGGSRFGLNLLAADLDGDGQDDLLVDDMAYDAGDGVSGMTWAFLGPF